MNRLGKDDGWRRRSAMTLCACGHREETHRPMSRKCSLCSCPEFKTEKNARKDKQAS